MYSVHTPGKVESFDLGSTSDLNGKRAEGDIRRREQHGNPITPRCHPEPPRFTHSSVLDVTFKLLISCRLALLSIISYH